MTGVDTVLVPLGCELYAIPIDWVREVVTAPSLTMLVTSPALVLGLFNLRGQIVPLLDTAALLGLGGVGAGSFALVLQSPAGLVALTATAFPERALLDSLTGPSELPGTAGVYRLHRRVVVLLDPAVLLASDRLGGADTRTLVAPARGG